MNHPRTVDHDQDVEKLSSHVPHEFRLENTSRLQAFLQILTRDEVHDDRRVTLPADHIVYGDDRRMPEPGERLILAPESRQRLIGANQLTVETFEGNPATGSRFTGREHPARGAHPNQP